MAVRKRYSTPSFCVSLVAHGMTLSGLAWWFVVTSKPPHTEPIQRWTLLQPTKGMTSAAPASAKSPPKPRPKPKLPDFEKQEPSQSPPRDDSGEAKGHGTANRSASGNQAMQAPQGLQQANLMRDEPDFSRIDPASPMPAAAGQEQGDNSFQKSTARAGVYSPQDTLADLMPVPSDDTTAPPAVKAGAGAAATPQQKQNTPPPTGSPQASLRKTPDHSTEDHSPKAIHGHLAQASDTESVPFSADNSITFQDGKVEGRQGLRVKTRIPRLGLAAENDLQRIGQLRVVIGVWIDAQGSVREAKVLESSGSSYIDEDIKNCIWENWTFEPPKDKDGNPMPYMWKINIF